MEPLDLLLQEHKSDLIMQLFKKRKRIFDLNNNFVKESIKIIIHLAPKLFNKNITKMKMKKRRRLLSKNRFALRRRIERKSKKMTKLQECGKIIEEKCCEICGKKQQDQTMILCDQCDDAYHWTCLDCKQSPSLTEIWLCPNCVEIQIKPNVIIDTPQNCFKCSKKIYQIPKLQYKCSGQIKQLNIYDHKFIECEICKMHFHPHCFSIRQNSINCWMCEIKIRRQGPKSHEEHLIFLRKQLQAVHERGYIQLQAKQQSQRQKEKRASLMGLKIFEELTDWQLITRYQGSLYYALKSRNLTFCDEQIYTSQQMLALNDSKKQVISICSLHQQDQQVYELFKAKIRKGAVGPYQIREDRVKGFYLVSLGHIKKGTIICEYAGQVSSHRASLTEKNDSIFTLLISGRSKEDLNIIPKSFGNMSRFICGVNNFDKQHSRKVNVSSVRFSYKNRIRIIFVAKKNIEKGDIFYLNYNAGTYEEYPTSDFV